MTSLNKGSQEKLLDIHPDLARVVYRAAEITTVPFVVTEGKRTLDRQKNLVKSGASTTMRSRHVAEMNQCGQPCAVDLAAFIDVDGDGAVDAGEIRWDWPLYSKINEAMQEAGRIEGVPIEWGGSWKSFRDGCHWQLPWSKYL